MISRFAPVAPVAVHHRLAEAGALGNYHLLLAHQVLENPELYKSFYRYHLPGLSNGKGDRRGKPYIIMDNSLIELGYPLALQDVLLAAELVNASVLVLPDVLGDRIQTLNVASKAVTELWELRERHAYARRVKALGVAQGQTFNDIFSCARDMIQTLKCEMISVPRHVTGKLGTRLDVTRAIAQYGKPIHLLGFSENLFDDMYTLSVKGVMGIDSAVPIWYGLQGFTLPANPPAVANFGRRPEDYEKNAEINQQVITNIRTVERWANIAKDARTRK